MSERKFRTIRVFPRVMNGEKPEPEAFYIGGRALYEAVPGGFKKFEGIESYRRYESMLNSSKNLDISKEYLGESFFSSLTIVEA